MAFVQRYHVAAGTFQTSEPQPLLLQAYLGTCVGLSLYCKETGIGGMIHLLLPEPVSMSNLNQPEKYASTGVPMFIEALVEMGAKRESLVATIAGGALVGPVSNQDLSLDIGGRTADRVREVLAANKIEVAQSETGGFFTCCLSIDMDNGHCTIEPAGQNKLVWDEKVRVPTMDEIKAAAKHLQPIPQVALKVLRLIDEEDQGIGRIADEIRKDQVITARTLSLANSALFTKKKEIESLDHALVFLGQEQLVKLIISAAVHSFFEQSSLGYSLCKGGLYHHAVGCAQVAEALAKKTGKVSPQKAYTAGLLHDIGKVVLDQYVAPAYPLFYRRAMEGSENVQEVEKRLLGTDHTQVGEMLAKQWSFPDSLVYTVRYHHCPDKESPHTLLATVVYLADLLLSRFQIGLEIERLDTETLSDRMAKLDLNTGSFAVLVDLIPSAVFHNTAEAASDPV